MRLSDVKYMEKKLSDFKSSIVSHNINPEEQEFINLVNLKIEELENTLLDLKSLGPSNAAKIIRWFKQNLPNLNPNLNTLLKFSATEKELVITIDNSFLNLNLEYNDQYEEINPQDHIKINDLCDSFNSTRDNSFISRINEWDQAFRINDINCNYEFLTLHISYSKKLVTDTQLQNSLLPAFVEQLGAYLNHLRDLVANDAIIPVRRRRRA